MKKLIVAQNEKLNELDTELQTYGCHHSNPDICSSNSLDKICAFVNSNCICKLPPRSWKKIYQKLREGRSD